MNDTEKLIEELGKYAACMPFADNERGIPETQAIMLSASNALRRLALAEKVVEAAKEVCGCEAITLCGELPPPGREERHRQLDTALSAYDAAKGTP